MAPSTPSGDSIPDTTPADAAKGTVHGEGTAELYGRTHRAETPRALNSTPPPDVLKQWLRDMMLIREFEVRSMQAYQNKLAGGFLHVYNGQEAVAVGCIGAGRYEDPVVTAYRDHGHALARGMDPKVGMAELFGRIGGCAPSFSAALRGST